VGNRIRGLLYCWRCVCPVTLESLM
jgi:hypothetical protein